LVGAVRESGKDVVQEGERWKVRQWRLLVGSPIVETGEREGYDTHVPMHGMTCSFSFAKRKSTKDMLK
jgi:hypothetical protein